MDRRSFLLSGLAAYAAWQTLPTVFYSFPSGLPRFAPGPRAFFMDPRGLNVAPFNTPALAAHDLGSIIRLARADDMLYISNSDLRGEAERLYSFTSKHRGTITIRDSLLSLHEPSFPWSHMETTLRSLRSSH